MKTSILLNMTRRALLRFNMIHQGKALISLTCKSIKWRLNFTFFSNFLTNYLWTQFFTVDLSFRIFFIGGIFSILLIENFVSLINSFFVLYILFSINVIVLILNYLVPVNHHKSNFYQKVLHKWFILCYLSQNFHCSRSIWSFRPWLLILHRSCIHRYQFETIFLTQYPLFPISEFSLFQIDLIFLFKVPYFALIVHPS